MMDIKLPCIHAANLPGEADRYLCKVAHIKNPSGTYCRDRCPVKIHPDAFVTSQLAEYSAAVNQGGYAVSRGIGLGDIVEKAIAIATFGQGKRIANKLAGPNGCGCNRRKNKLNRIRLGRRK